MSTNRCTKDCSGMVHQADCAFAGRLRLLDFLPPSVTAEPVGHGIYKLKDGATQALFDGEAFEEEDEFTRWWRTTSEGDLRHSLTKRAEYGSRDLVRLGEALFEFAGVTREDDDESEWEQVCAELGILFYLEGKLARALEAYRQGNLPSTDTYDDLRVYSWMLGRVRETGSW